MLQGEDPAKKLQSASGTATNGLAGPLGQTFGSDGPKGDQVVQAGRNVATAVGGGGNGGDSGR